MDPFPHPPLELWTQELLGRLSSVIDTPLFMDRTMTGAERIGFARCFVEVSAASPPPSSPLPSNLMKSPPLMLRSLTRATYRIVIVAYPLATCGGSARRRAPARSPNRCLGWGAGYFCYSPCSWDDAICWCSTWRGGENARAAGSASSVSPGATLAIRNFGEMMNYY